MSKLPKGITLSDISYILNNPWKISAKEWDIDNESSQRAALSLILKRLNSTLADGYSKIWRTPNNKPIAILGGYKFEDKTYETFFIASKHMDEHALKLSFDMRQILKEQSPFYKGCKCAIYSESNHPKQMTWFRFLGFKYVPEGNIGNTKYFEYVSPVI